METGIDPVAPTLKNPCEIGKNHDFTRVFDLKKKRKILTLENASRPPVHR